MSLGTIAIVLSAVGVFITGYLALAFTSNPVKAMAQVNHLPEYLPQAMANRYIGFFLLAVAATISREVAVITILFAVFAFIGLADGRIYQKAGKPYLPHVAAGGAAALVAVAALAAWISGGAA